MIKSLKYKKHKDKTKQWDNFRKDLTIFCTKVEELGYSEKPNYK